MMQSLRVKLALSHALPFLLLMPILTLYLFYSLEDFFNQNLLQQLTYQARLVQNRAQQNPTLIESQPAAENLLSEISPLTDARVVLLSRDTTILASTRSEDAERIGTRYTDDAIQRALGGETAQGIGPGFTTDVAYVVLPLRSHGVTTGVLRLSYEVDDVRAQFAQLRWTVLLGVILTALGGLGLGLGLATTITRPLRRLGTSARQIAAGDYRERVPIRSQDEVGQLAQNFNQMAARLEEAEQIRTRQLAAIVHELTRPLAGMRAALETLREYPNVNVETRDEFLDGLTDELARLERLLSTLRGVAKGALRPMQLNCSAVSLERVIRASIAHFKPIAANSGITLNVELPTRLPSIRADEDRLIQVMMNLIDNALKFTPHGSSISVSVGAHTDHLWVRVADTGAGIATEEMEHLFQQFYRGAESRPPEKRGMGLGLAICREIIMAHGGEIQVDSEVGQGTQFTFTLPK
ncbi:MAG: HAMP domain-containing protein [Chloroflexi bacterium]|nr:HAMP domain-containing protein [Chloroflexota bacterium]